MHTPQTRSTPPRANEIEISLFGPGIGECLVVHLGAGKWMVVDSCLGPNREPVALDYLANLGVDVAKDVALVVVTHWDDDHVRGISRVVRRADNAQVAFSAALCQRDLRWLVEAANRVKLVAHNNGLSELGYILEILTDNAKGTTTVGPHHWAQANLQLYNDPSRGVEVVCLSPSAQAVTDALGGLGKLLTPGSRMRAFQAFRPNDQSVVLLVRTPLLSFLLGADLAVGSDDRRGWRAVIKMAADHGSRRVPKSSAYKVAHHGSPNSDCPEIWRELLEPGSHAMLAPFAGGRNALPTSQDVKRISSTAGSVYCCRWPVKQKLRKRSVDQTISSVAKNNNRWAISRTPGQIRLRVPVSGDLGAVIVDLFDGARKL